MHNDRLSMLNLRIECLQGLTPDIMKRGALSSSRQPHAIVKVDVDQ